MYYAEIFLQYPLLSHVHFSVHTLSASLEPLKSCRNYKIKPQLIRSLLSKEKENPIEQFTTVWVTKTSIHNFYVVQKCQSTFLTCIEIVDPVNFAALKCPYIPSGRGGCISRFRLILMPLSPMMMLPTIIEVQSSCYCVQKKRIEKGTVGK